MTDTINGWTPPLVYDLVTDSKRIATQADIDALLVIRQAYNRLRKTLQALDEDHVSVVKTLETIARCAASPS